MNRISLKFEGGKVIVRNGEMSVALDWPAIRIGLLGQVYADPEPISRLADNSQWFAAGPLKMKVSYLVRKGYVLKQVAITSEKELPPPDFVDVDCQTVSDPDLSVRGYRRGKVRSNTGRGEEDGCGTASECGYPLIGKYVFTGLEHQAGFNMLKEKTECGSAYVLRHHPCWRGHSLENVDAVFGLSSDPDAGFLEYLRQVALPPPTKPLFSFCTFWSDPYAGNCEYKTSREGYESYVAAFERLGLRPDVYTLDAGWQERRSIYDAKESLGGNPWLAAFSRKLKRLGTGLSLWYSSNGPMGMDPDYLKEIGIAVGGGKGAAYSGDNFGVLMDPKLEGLLTARFCALAGPEYKAVHFKVDWDNECAVSPEFKRKYPTVNHVREASINAVNRIAAAIRKVNPDIVLRNGWSPSPWWLLHANHTMLPDSGDCSYSAFPSKDQRNSAMTHRDGMYYNCFRRDRSQVPLAFLDNHEFPSAPRNIMGSGLSSFSSSVWMSALRGTTYITWMIQPASLDDRQAEIMRGVMAFVRAYGKNIYGWNSRMILGRPPFGEIYGFLHPGKQESWCIFRNPSPMPQRVNLSNAGVSHAVRSVLQFYPDFRLYSPADEVTMLPHEVKVLIFSAKERKLPFHFPFLCTWENGRITARFQASRSVSEKVRPPVDKIYQSAVFAFADQSLVRLKGITQIFFSLSAPYHMRMFELNFKLTCKGAESIRLKLFCSRYPLKYDPDRNDTFAVPITEIPFGEPGGGEALNPGSCLLSGARYFSAAIPSGGKAFYCLELDRKDIAASEIMVAASGYEAPSANGIVLRSAPGGFDACLPPGHPLGFPICLTLPL